MTQDQIKNLINRNRIFLSACVVLLLVLVWSIATTKNKLYIQTAQPEDNFIVVCGWYSDVLSFHGGAGKVRERILVSKSNTESACGWWFYGDLSVEVLHPLYRMVSGCDWPEMCTNKYFHVEDRKMMFKPIGFGQFIDSLPDSYKDEKLVEKIRTHIGGHFMRYYFKQYAKVRDPDIEQLKRLYNDRLLTILNPIYVRYDLGNGGSSPEGILNVFWRYGQEMK